MSDNYVETTRSVLDSAKLLLNEIQVGSGNLQPAIEDLAKTAQLHEEQGVGAQALRFSALDTDADKTTKQQMTEEILANALSDVQVANVLMTAGWAVGELDEAPNVPQFQQAVLGLEETLETVKEVTGDSGGSGPAYFAPPQNGGTEMPAADRFADRVASTLSSFVGDAQSVL
ncbi:MAG TPA: hypothetical protein VJZ91_07430, partial [Blastocatellia bacterium]|nr:hypothetical protein [Blastocatellia bacterium]